MNFIKTFLAALLALFVFIVIGVLILMAVGSMGDQSFEVKDNSILHLKLEREIVDRYPGDQLEVDLGPFMTSSKDGLNHILTQLQKAKVDPLVKGVFLDIKAPMAGLASLQEIRDALLDFKSGGKWIVSYSDFYSQSGYYLASAADEVYMEPEGMLDFRGLRSDVTFMKGLLNKLGVEVQVIRPKNNRFKSAVEPYLLDSMSTSNEEQLDKILTSIWAHMAQDISASRNLSSDQLEKATSELLSRNTVSAKEAGLIDGSKYRDEVMSNLMEKVGIEKEDDLEMISLHQYGKSNTSAFSDPEKRFARDKVAVIYGIGEINMGDGDEESIGSDGLASLISEARKDSSIKAIVLRVNSPGGSALASDVIWREMTLAKKSKPVIVSMGDVAASGGYYIACNADKIMASEMTITGSIGVFGMIPNTEGLNEDILGLKHDGVKTHKYADLMDIHRPLRADEEAVWQETVDHIYDDFTGKVATGRQMEQEYVNSIGQGRVWSGVDAMDIKLIDSYGGLTEAIAEAAAMAELDDYRVQNFPEAMDPLEQIMKDLTGQTKTDPMAVLSQGDLELYKMLKTYKELKEMKGVQMRMPFLLDIH